jgi:hypothetical protein
MATTVIADIYLYGCRPQHMARFIITAFHAVINSHTTQVFHGGKTGRNRFGVLHSIKRYFRIRTVATLPLVAFFLEQGIFYLQLSGVKKDNLGYLRRRLRAVYLALIALTYQFGQKSTVVQMSMS